MNPDDLLNAIGLLISQLRVARRALEDIERSTARYNSFAFASALGGGGAKFGEPPMFGGALKVWVVNINDLAPGAGGGFLEQLLGGIGRFLGGLGGGAVGGLLGGWALPDMISNVQKIADSVERILQRLGIDLSSSDSKKDDSKTSGPGIIDTLVGLQDIFQTFTALFLAASGKSEPEGTSLRPPSDKWLAVVNAASELLNGIDRVVQGLTFLIPVVVGALAEFITQLDSIKLAIVDLLQFLLRELFLLRGVLLTTIYDTVSGVAKLASSLLGILSVAVNTVVGSIFSIFGQVFKAAIAAIKFLSDGLQATIDTVVRWLVDTIGDALFTIGDSLVFREVVHIVQLLPAILPPLVLAIQGLEGAKKFDDAGMGAALKTAASITTAAAVLPAHGPRSASLTSPSPISDSLLPKARVDDLNTTLDTAVKTTSTELKNAFGTATKGFEIAAKQLDDAAKDEDFTKGLGPHVKAIQDSSKTLADSLKLSEDAAVAATAAAHPKTGLEVIAQAYEGWLGGGGLKTLLDNVTSYFTRPGAADALKDKVIGPTTIDRPRATVDIEDLIIEVAPPSENEPKFPGDAKLASAQTPEDTLRLVVELVHEMSERGFKFNPGSPLLQV